MKAYLGIDVGAVSTNLALLDENLEVVFVSYLRTAGDPLSSSATPAMNVPPWTIWS